MWSLVVLRCLSPKFLQDLGQKTLDALNKSGKTSIDTSSLIEHTLLHELTHCRAVGDSQAKLDQTEAYGRDKCVAAKSAINSGMADFHMYSYMM